MVRHKWRSGALLALIALAAAACGGDDSSTSDTTVAAVTTVATTDSTAPSTTDGATPTTADAATTTAAADTTVPDDVGSMKIAAVCGGISSLVSSTAFALDAYAAHGLDAELVCVDGGPEAIQAMIGGSVQAFVGSQEHILSTRAQGLDIKGYAALNQSMPFTLITKTDSDIKTVADLKGQQVGITSPGSLSDTELKLALDSGGLAYDDVTPVGLGGAATLQAALDNDRVPAAMMFDPALSGMIASGDYRVVWEPDFHYAGSVVIADAGWVADHEATMKAFLAGLHDTYEQIVADPQVAVDAVGSTFEGIDPTVVAAAIQRTAENSIPDGLVLDEQAFNDTLSVLATSGSEYATPAEGSGFADDFDFSLLPS